jgi:hypothetical protein
MSFQASRWAWLQSAPLSATQKLVLLALADYANEAHTCWPTLATLAEKTRLSRRAVINALARLVDLNLVTRVPRGPHRTFLYILAVEDEATVPEKVHGIPFEGSEQHVQGAAGLSSKVHEMHPYVRDIEFQGTWDAPFKVHPVHLDVSAIDFHDAPEILFKVHEVHLDVHPVLGGDARGAPREVHQVHPNLSYEPIKEPLTELSAASSPSETGVTASPEDDTPTRPCINDDHSSQDPLSSEVPQSDSPSEIPPDDPSPETPRQTFQRWMGLFEQTGFSRKSLGTPTVLAGLRQWINHGVTDDDIHDALFIAKARLNGALPGSPAYLLKIMPGLLQEKQQASQLFTFASENAQPLPTQPFHPTLRERYLHESDRRPTPLSSAERMRQAGLEYLRRRGVLEPELCDVFE